MNIEANSLFASLLIGTLGLALLTYGKKQSRFPQMIVGLVLLVYPYFVPNVWVMIGIAVGLIGLLWGGIRLGM